jgi:hypothetical protein
MEKFVFVPRTLEDVERKLELKHLKEEMKKAHIIKGVDCDHYLWDCKCKPDADGIVMLIESRFTDISIKQNGTYWRVIATMLK